MPSGVRLELPGRAALVAFPLGGTPDEPVRPSNFTAGLAQMLGSKGRVNAVAPGPIWTPLIPSTMPPEKVKVSARICRPGQHRELAGIFVLLASEEGSYMTGGIHAVTGGTPLL